MLFELCQIKTTILLRKIHVFQHFPKIAQDRAKMAQDEPKVARRKGYDGPR